MSDPHPFAVELARFDALPRALLEIHADDGTGHCQVCSAGAQTGRYQHPCTIRTLAGQALVIQSRALGEGQP